MSLVDKEFDRIGLDRLGDYPRWKAIRLFLDSLSVVENEYLDLTNLGETPFAECYSKFLDILREYKLLTWPDVGINSKRAGESRN